MLPAYQCVSVSNISPEQIVILFFNPQEIMYMSLTDLAMPETDKVKGRLQ